MATVSVVTSWSPIEGQKCVLATVTLSSNYTLGGEALNASNFSLNAIQHIVPMSFCNGYGMVWDNVAGKMLAYGLSNGAILNGAPMIACQGGVNFTGAVVPVLVVGKPQ